MAKSLIFIGHLAFENYHMDKMVSSSLVLKIFIQLEISRFRL